MSGQHRLETCGAQMEVEGWETAGMWPGRAEEQRAGSWGPEKAVLEEEGLKGQSAWSVSLG